MSRIQSTFGSKKAGGIIMGNRLNLPLVQHESGFDQCFPIAGGAGVDDLGGFRHLGIDFLDWRG